MMGSAHSNRVQTRWRSLVRKTEFQEIYDDGVKLVGRLVVVYLLEPRPAPGRTAAPDPAPDLARAVVASRKIGNAVARNRAKRLLREAHRQGLLADGAAVEQVRSRFLPGAICADGVPVDAGNDTAAEAATESTTPAGLWIVLVARRRILAATAREVRDELDTLLRGDPRPQ